MPVSMLHVDRLSRWTHVALICSAAAALLGVLIRGDEGVALDTLALLLLGTLPGLRVATLAVRWARAGDRRFASAAVALLLLMSVGVLVVAVWR